MSKGKGGGIGVQKVKEILRLARMGLSQSQISRSTAVSRPTVQEYLRRADALGLTQERVEQLSEDGLREIFGKKPVGRKPRSEAIDFAKIHTELSRKGVTLQLLWEEYYRENPAGLSYSRFCQNHRNWCKQHQLSMRQEYKGGEKVLVDFSGLRAELADGSLAEIFVAALGASNLTYVEATPGQDLSSWIGAHIRAFEYLGGVPEVVVPDNLKSGVTHACRYEPEINRTYQELAEHYGIAVIPTRVKSPRDKAKVEEAVQNVQRRILAPLRDSKFSTVAEVNTAIRPLLEELNGREQQVYGCSRRELFEQIDKPFLRALPVQPFIFSTWKAARVNIDYHVEIERHYYSVPCELVQQRVDVRICEKTVEIFHKNKRIISHLRSNLAGRHTTIKEHMPLSHQQMLDWTPSRFLEWAAKIGAETKQQVDALLRARAHPAQGYRACLGLLRLVKTFTPARLEAACRRANHFGIVSMRSVRSILDTGQDKLPLQRDEEAASLSDHENLRGDIYFH